MVIVIPPFSVVGEHCTTEKVGMEVAELKKVEESEKHGGHTTYYSEPEYYRDQDRPHGRMYYPMYADGSSGSMSSGSSGNGSGRSYYSEDRIPYDMVMRDRREGQSPMSRRRYMEAKEMKHDKNT